MPSRLGLGTEAAGNSQQGDTGEMGFYTVHSQLETSLLVIRGLQHSNKQECHSHQQPEACSQAESKAIQD